MKNYTEPKLEIVAVKAEDVIRTSVVLDFFKLFRNSGIEDGGRASLNDYTSATMD